MRIAQGMSCWLSWVVLAVSFVRALLAHCV